MRQTEVRRIRTDNVREREKRYRIPDVARAIGFSEGSINSYFGNRGVGTKGGLTLDQIVEYLNYISEITIRDKRNIQWEAVKDIQARLMREKGMVSVAPDQNPDWSLDDCDSEEDAEE